MKKLYYLLFIAFMSISAIYCSDSQDFPGRMSPEDRAARLNELLDLTDEQTKKVVQIYKDSQETMSEMREQFQGDRSQMREKMMENREETTNKIEEILYDDQIELYREYQEERQQFRRDRREQRQQKEQ